MFRELRPLGLIAVSLFACVVILAAYYNEYFTLKQAFVDA